MSASKVEVIKLPEPTELEAAVKLLRYSWSEDGNLIQEVPDAVYAVDAEYVKEAVTFLFKSKAMVQNRFSASDHAELNIILNAYNVILDFCLSDASKRL